MKSKFGCVELQKHLVVIILNGIKRYTNQHIGTLTSMTTVIMIIMRMSRKAACVSALLAALSSGLRETVFRDFRQKYYNVFNL